MSTLSAALLEHRCSVAKMTSLSGAGVYAYFIADPPMLPDILVPENEIIYVGMTEDGLDARNHVNHDHSGFSSFRRSLGAIIKENLDLKALPRSSGASRSNLRCYRFTEQGEAALTEWMKENLLCAQVEVAEDVSECERGLIATLQPPLNLKGWPNPQASAIKALRAACVREAELVASGLR